MNWKKCFLPKLKPQPSVPTWLKVALKEEGVKEIPGSKDEPRIKAYRRPSGHEEQSDPVAWCADFVGWCLTEAGLEGTRSQAARSYLKWGKEISQPVLGAVTVLWRESRDSWKGHVGFYCGETSTHVLLFGGNQGDKVCMEEYPKERVLSYRWPE
jgi:uncharacterized protein (TIGR02594 family)